MTRREFCQLAALGVVATPGAVQAFPVPSGAIVLDDCDPEYRGQEKYADNLSFFNADGTLRTRVSGLNVCQEAGNVHKIGVDLLRGRVWVNEFVSRRLLRFDLNGKQLQAIGVKAHAVAVDPATGHAWLTVVPPSGRSDQSMTEVYDETGRHRETFTGHGYDIVYDPFGKAMWHANTQLVKLSTTGKEIAHANFTHQSYAMSLAVSHRTGTVWVAVEECDAGRGANELLAFDNACKPLRTISLGDEWPRRVVIDPRDDGAWIALRKKLLRKYTANGKKEHEIEVPVLSVDVERATGNLWVATADEVLKMTPDGKILQKTRHKAATTQAWVAAY